MLYDVYLVMRGRRKLRRLKTAQTRYDSSPRRRAEAEAAEEKVIRVAMLFRLRPSPPRRRGARGKTRKKKLFFWFYTFPYFDFGLNFRPQLSGFSFSRWLND